MIKEFNMKALFLTLLCVGFMGGTTNHCSEQQPYKETECKRCVGASPCKACSNCSACKHCHVKGGTCGICERWK